MSIILRRRDHNKGVQSVLHGKLLERILPHHFGDLVPLDRLLQENDLQNSPRNNQAMIFICVGETSSLFTSRGASPTVHPHIRISRIGRSGGRLDYAVMEQRR